MKIHHYFAAAVATGVSLLMSCSQSEDVTSKATKSDGGILHLYCWPEYFDPAALELFTKRTGIEVDYKTFESAGEMEARLRSDPDQIDVMVIDSFQLNKLRQVSLLMPLDHALLANLSNIDKRYLNSKFDEGNQFSVPYTWGTSLVAYRKDVITPDAPSWSLLWDPRLKGKIMMVEDSIDPHAAALLYLGKSPNTRDPADFDAATEALISQIKELDARYGSVETVKEKLISGEVSAALLFSGDAALISEENENIEYFLPSEGAPMWIDNLAISRDSPNSKAAHAFINFLCEPEIAAMNSNSHRYANPCKTAKPFMDPELVNDERIYPNVEMLERCIPLAGLDAERESLINRSSLRVKRAWSEARERIAAQD